MKVKSQSEVAQSCPTLSDPMDCSLPGSSFHRIFQARVLEWGANTWCEKLTHLKRSWCWERLRAGGEGDDRGWDGWMASLTQWTWVWVNSGSWWWTGRPGVLRSMGSQRVRQDWVTELNWMNVHLPLRVTFLGGRGTPLGLQDFSSPIKYWTQATSVKALSPNHWTTRKLPLELLLKLEAKMKRLSLLYPNRKTEPTLDIPNKKIWKASLEKEMEGWKKWKGDEAI